MKARIIVMARIGLIHLYLRIAEPISHFAELSVTHGERVDVKSFYQYRRVGDGRETIRETVLRIFIQNCMMSNFLKRACGKQFTRHAEPFLLSIINLLRPTEIKTVRSTHSEIRRTKTAFDESLTP